MKSSPSTPSERRTSILAKILIAFVRFYQRSEPVRRSIAANLHLPVEHCRFQPTCSQYMIEAIRRYGSFRGTLLGLRRFVRCGPWSPGGYDPVP